MMEKFDKIAIRIFNWTIVNSIAASIYLIMMVLNILGNSIGGDYIYKSTYKDIKDAIEEMGGIKK